MDIDTNEEEDNYEFLSIDRYQQSKKDEKKLVVKQTLLNSPIITNIVPNFKVQINKPFKGLSSVLFNDEEFQTLIPKEDDSQLDAFDDIDDEEDDLLFLGVSTNQSETTQEDKNTNVTLPSQIEDITVLVKYLSIVVDGIEFSTKSPIRSSCVIKSTAPDQEDHLLIALKSGYLLLIRIYYVPRYYRDNDYLYQTQKSVPQDEGNSIFKPFIIQWWDTGSNNASPNLDSCGYLLRSSPSGFSTVACASSGIFRLYMTQQIPNTNGTVLRNHINIPIDGFIIDACFINPSSTSIPTDVFFTLLFTENRRLSINLFSWSSSEGVWQGYNKDVLPLDNTFEIPVFVVPLKKNGSFLFVSPNKLTIITMHNIISAHYDFQVIESPWKSSSFPTSYHLPSTSISSLEIDKMDEVLVATDNGVIYLITVIENNFGSSICPVVRVAESISQFSMEKEKETEKVRLIYTSDSGSSSKDILIDEIYSKEYLSDISHASKLAYSEAKLIEDFKSWAPLIDISVIDSTSNKKEGDVLPDRQELWGISGLGKRTKLNHFRFGYYGARKSNTYEKLRKSVGMWKLKYKGSYYLLCAMPFESILLEYQEDSKEAFVEVQESKLLNNVLTLYSSVVVESYILQITQTSITISDLVSQKITENVLFSILFADVSNDVLAMVVEENNTIKLKILRMAPKELFQEDNDLSNYFELVLEQEINGTQPSMLKMFFRDDFLVISIGSFEGLIIFYTLKDGQLSEYNSYDLRQYCKYSHDNIIRLDVIIPNQIIVLNDEIVIATKQGYIIKFKFGDCNLECVYFLRLGYAQVKIIPTSDPKLLFVHCGKLWLFNNYKNELYPNQVNFDDTFERLMIEGIELDGLQDSKFKKLALIRDNGLVICQVSTFTKPSIKQFSKIENGKKLIFIPHISTFVVFCHGRNKMVCIDKKSMKSISQRETNLKSRHDDSEYTIFQDEEVPQCVNIWEVQRNETNKRVSKKLLVGCSKSPTSGVIKVLDFKKLKHETTGQPLIIITELTSIEQDFPISNILQFKSLILFTNQETIYCTSYNESEKRFTPIKQLKSLPSKIISLNESNDKLLVSTNSDSIYQFTEQNGELIFHSSDPISNSYINQVQLGNFLIAGDKIHSNLSIFENFKFDKRLNLGVSGIPRVYLSKLNNPWVIIQNQDQNQNLIDDNNDNDKSVICISTNGEIINLRMINQSDNELINLNSQTKTPLNNLIQKLERPFINKLSGTGLLSLNKPRFNCLINQNNESIVDYDLEELSSHDSIINL